MSGSGISWAICKSAPRSRQITTPVLHHSVFYRPDALPAAQPTASKHWRHWRNIHVLQEKVLFILWVLQSLYILAIWLHHHPLCGVDSVHLQMLWMGTCQKTMWFMVCRWPQSQAGDWARPHLCKLAWHGPWPVRKRFIRDHVCRVEGDQCSEINQQALQRDVAHLTSGIVSSSWRPRRWIRSRTVSGRVLRYTAP